MTRSCVSCPRNCFAIYVPQIVQQMITDRAMAYEANRLGMRVSSDETENAILVQPARGNREGRQGGTFRATLNAVLQQEGVTMADLKDDTSRQLVINRLRQIVSEGVVVSPREIADEFHRKNDKVRVDYVLLAPGQITSRKRSPPMPRFRLTTTHTRLLSRPPRSGASPSLCWMGAKSPRQILRKST